MLLDLSSLPQIALIWLSIGLGVFVGVPAGIAIQRGRTRKERARMGEATLEFVRVTKALAAERDTFKAENAALRKIAQESVRMLTTALGPDDKLAARSKDKPKSDKGEKFDRAVMAS